MLFEKVTEFEAFLNIGGRNPVGGNRRFVLYFLEQVILVYRSNFDAINC